MCQEPHHCLWLKHSTKISPEWNLYSQAASILEDTEKTYYFCLTELAAFVLPAHWKKIFRDSTFTLKL